MIVELFCRLNGKEQSIDKLLESISCKKCLFEWQENKTHTKKL